MTDTVQWLVAYSKANSERKAQRWLREKGRVVYLPLLNTVAITLDGTEETAKPLFPRYLFVRDDPEFDPVDAGYTPGLSHLVRVSQEKFARVSDDVIEAFKKSENASGLVDPPPPFEQGEDVQVKYGDVDLVARFVSMKDHDRATVLLTLFGAAREAVVDIDQVRKFFG